MKLSSLLALIVFPILTAGTMGQTSSNCMLSCRNGGECMTGAPDFSDHTYLDGKALPFLTHLGLDTHHCKCPSGFTGLLCQHDFRECIPQGSENSGEIKHKCYHGGECAKVFSIDAINGFSEVHYACDCANAIDENGTHYVGRYCEFSTNKPCLAGHDEFCVNEGECFLGDVYQYLCACNASYAGEHCEYRRDELPLDNSTLCELNCANGGVCRLGFDLDNETLAFQPQGGVTTHNFQHCDCPADYDGVLCEHQLCSQRQCQNGAYCVESKSSTGHLVAACNCTAASNVTTSFAGLNCEYASTIICNYTDPTSQNFFCVNGGTCSTTDIGLPRCSCLDGFHGPHCELAEDTQAPSCHLSCQNGGECRNGIKNYGILENYPAPVSFLVNTSGEELEHCECPPGFAGNLCEHKAEICGDNTHVCFHGSECVLDRDGMDWECDCRTADSLSAGEYCQYQDPIICSDALGYCFHGGNCTNNTSPGAPACSCPAGYLGVHCDRYSPLPDTGIIMPSEPPSQLPSQNPSTPLTPPAITPSPLPTTPLAPVFTPSPSPLPSKTPSVSPSPRPTRSPELSFRFNPAAIVWDDDFIALGFDDDALLPKHTTSHTTHSNRSRAVVAVSATLIAISAVMFAAAYIVYRRVMKRERERAIFGGVENFLRQGLARPGNRRRANSEEQLQQHHVQQNLII